MKIEKKRPACKARLPNISSATAEYIAHAPSPDKDEVLQPSADYQCAYVNLYGRPKRQNRFRPDLLPEPAGYYARHLQGLRFHGDWAAARCPFHDDKNPSLSINRVHGGYCCHACGARGGDVLDFHRRLTGMRFKEAAKDLNAWEGV